MCAFCWLFKAIHEVTKNICIEWDLKVEAVWVNRIGVLWIWNNNQQILVVYHGFDSDIYRHLNLC